MIAFFTTVRADLAIFNGSYVMPLAPESSSRTSAQPDPSASTFLRWLGWIATATAIGMFFSYIDQIRLNLAGEKGSLLMPLATVVNCSLWTTYGTMRRDWPVAAGNFPGVILGAVTFLTAL